MSLATAQKIVDFAQRLVPPEHGLPFCPFGGEPLMCFDLMQEVTNYIREREIAVDRPVCLRITTNGTLLTHPMLDFLK